LSRVTKAQKEYRRQRLAKERRKEPWRRDLRRFSAGMLRAITSPAVQWWSVGPA
jgi:hypothetical protein